MAVAQTSREAYADYMSSPAPGRHEDRIIAYIGHFFPTRMEIAHGTGIRLSSVCACVNRLIKEGVLGDGITRPCSHTGRKAKEVFVI